MIHDLKCWTEYFDLIADGTKTFEIRKDDRGFKVGDVLHLRNYDPHTGTYVGDSINAEVIYLINAYDFPGLTIGYVAMQIRVLGESEEAELMEQKGAMINA